MKNIKNMLLNETICIGCESDEVAVPGSAELLAFDASTVIAHATIASTLNGVFFRALAQSRHFGNIPYKVCLCFPDNKIDRKKKETDSESIYDRLVWYIKNMHPPKNGIIFSMYIIEGKWQRFEKVPWAINSVWPFKRQWKPLDQYVTLQTVEPDTYSDRRMHEPQRVDHVNAAIQALESFNTCLPYIESYCNANNLEIKYVDYTMPYDDIYELILGSNCHFSYPGATMYFAMACGTLTFAIHKFIHSKPEDTYNFAYRDPETGIEYLDGQMKPYTRYGRVTNGPTRIQQYSPQLDKVYQKHLHQLVDIASVKGLLNEMAIRELL